MANVKLTKDGEVSPEVQKIFDEVKRENAGHLPATHRAMAHFPAYLANTHERLRLVFGRGKIPIKTKVMVALTVSILNNCETCIDSYTKRLKRMGTSDEELTELLAVIDVAGGINHFNIGLKIRSDD